MKKAWLKWLFLTMGIFLLWANLVQAQTLKLEISLSKQVYLEGEPIWLDCWLTNIGEDTLRTWGLCLQCYWGPQVLVIDSKGDTLPYTGPHWEVAWRPGTIPGFILQPQESDYDCYDLVESFHQKPSLYSFYLTALDTGEYRVKARYRRAESKEFRFEVKPPEADEAKAYQLLKDALGFLISRNDSLEHQSLTELLAKYPSSVYAPKACRLLFRWEDILDRYPDSGFSENAIRNLTGEKSGMTEEEKKEFLQKIIKKHPETRSAKFAEQMLRLGY
jgi:hypothetical protein